MVQAVHAFVHERWHQHRHTHQQVPAGVEARHGIGLHMGEFVDEAAGAIQRQDGDGDGSSEQPARRRDDSKRRRGIAKRCRYSEIGPIDARIMAAKVARELCGRAQQHAFVGAFRGASEGNRRISIGCSRRDKGVRQGHYACLRANCGEVAAHDVAVPRLFQGCAGAAPGRAGRARSRSAGRICPGSGQGRRCGGGYRWRCGAVRAAADCHRHRNRSDSCRQWHGHRPPA